MNLHRTLPAKRPLSLAMAAIALLPLASHANQSLSTTGYGLTVGPVFSRANVGSAAYNPANAVRLVADDEKVRLGVMQFGARYEIGAVNDVQKVSDQIKADIDTARAANSAAQAETLARKINDTYLPMLDVGARGNVQGQVSLATPLLWRTEKLPGVWSLNANAQAQAAGVFRSSDVGVALRFTSSDSSVNNSRISVPVAGLTNQLSTLETALSSGTSAQQNAALQGLTGLLNSADQATLQNLLTATANNSAVSGSFAVTSSSAFDFKVAQVNQISLGYASDLTRYAPAGLTNLGPKGTFDVGVRVNLYQAQLYRQLAAFVDADGNSQTISLSSDRSYRRKASAVGLDLGAMWSAANYQLGMSLYNVNGPKLRYPSPLDDPNLANRQAAQALAAAGKIGLEDSVSLKPHLVLEGSLFSDSKRWLLQGSLAMNQTTDFVGDPQKNLTLSASYNAEQYEQGWLNYVLPCVRLGYRRNLVGSQLSTVGLGLSWGVVNLDLSTSTQKVQADGHDVPRAAGVSLSVAEKF